jgi:predicted SnoaL-like aldol condensation-catalyzing enzyme
VANPEENKAVVLDYYRTAFAGDPERAVREHFGPVYIQHNPEAADGPEAFIGFVNWLRAENPDLTLDIKRAIAEGDMVATHAHLTSSRASCRALAGDSRTAKSSSTG